MAVTHAVLHSTSRFSLPSFSNAAYITSLLPHPFVWHLCLAAFQARMARHVWVLRMRARAARNCKCSVQCWTRSQFARQWMEAGLCEIGSGAKTAAAADTSAAMQGCT